MNSPFVRRLPNFLSRMFAGDVGRTVYGCHGGAGVIGGQSCSPVCCDDNTRRIAS